MSHLKYVIGNALAPQSEKTNFIAHCCNDIGAWGAGFVIAISNISVKPEMEYGFWARPTLHRTASCAFIPLDVFELGAIQIVPFRRNDYIVNIIGQRSIGKDSEGNPPIRYEAITAGFEKLLPVLKTQNGELHVPRLGVGLAGGSWDKIEEILIECIVKQGIDVTVYTLPNETFKFDFVEGIKFDTEETKE